MHTKLRPAPPVESRQEPPRPTLDPRALFVRLKGAAGNPQLAQALGASVERVAEQSPLFRYAWEHPEASLIPLYPELGRDSVKHAEFELVLPDTSPARRLSALYHLTVASPEERERLEVELRSDPFVEVVRQPVVQYAVEPLPEITDLAPDDPQWGLRACKFPEVWSTLDVGPDPGPIAVLDQGGDPGHAELDRRIEVLDLPRSRKAAEGTHAGEVCGIIAARRDDGKGIDGCCSASIQLYNVAGDDGQPDTGAYSAALAAVARGKARVLNISMGNPVPDPDIAAQIAHCIDSGVVVVAAMGDRGKEGSPVLYPAALDGVIAVGATDSEGRRPRWASSGRHMFICAPGQFIRTVSGKNDLTSPSGTSYSTAIVSAAVWLMLRARPCLSVAAVRDILRTSVNTTNTGGMRTVGFGYGQLDMMKMCQSLVNVPICPPPR